MSTERDARKADADKRFGRQMAALRSYTFTPLFYRYPGFWKLPPPGLPWLYSDGLKLSMPVKCHLQLPAIRAGFFYNESFVGKFCENVQGNMRLSATHRLPPAKKPSSQHVKHLNPIFSKIFGIRGVLCTLCSPHRMPPKTYTNVIVVLQNIFLQ